MFEGIGDRRSYLQLCWEHARYHWAVSVVAGTLALYAAVIDWVLPLVQLPAWARTEAWPKIPLPWAVAIVFAAVFFVAAEGGFRLYRKTISQTPTQFLSGGWTNLYEERKKVQEELDGLEATPEPGLPHLAYSAARLVSGEAARDDWRERQRLRKVESKKRQLEVIDGILKGASETFPGAPASEREKKSGIDAEIYRVVVSGKAAVAGIMRDIYHAMEREEELVIDSDILVEMYIVNTTDHKRYIKDLRGTVEIDGKPVSLIRQKDFYAWDFGDAGYEYCLNPSANDSDRSGLEALPPLFPYFPLELESRQPAEGWVHFVVKDVDPRKLDENRGYRFVLTDSLGEQISVTTASGVKRTGKITVRMIDGPFRPR